MRKQNDQDYFNLNLRLAAASDMRGIERWCPVVVLTVSVVIVLPPLPLLL